MGPSVVFAVASTRPAVLMTQASPWMSRLAAPCRRNGFVILRAVRSPPAAPHPVSRRRSCLRLHVSRLHIGWTFTPLTRQHHGRTHPGKAGGSPAYARRRSSQFLKTSSRGWNTRGGRCKQCMQRCARGLNVDGRRSGNGVSKSARLKRRLSPPLSTAGHPRKLATTDRRFAAPAIVRQDSEVTFND